MRILVVIAITSLILIMARTVGASPAVLHSKILWHAIFEYCNGRARCPEKELLWREIFEYCNGRGRYLGYKRKPLKNKRRKPPPHVICSLECPHVWSVPSDNLVVLSLIYALIIAWSVLLKSSLSECAFLFYGCYYPSLI